MNSPEKEKKEQGIYDSFFAESDHLKTLRPKPKQEWSDEDEEKLKAICTYLRDYSRLAKLDDKLRFNEYCDFLESLRPSWKPSEEHFQGLRRAILKADTGSDAERTLKDLYEQLKKLI